MKPMSLLNPLFFSPRNIIRRWNGRRNDRPTRFIALEGLSNDEKKHSVLEDNNEIRCLATKSSHESQDCQECSNDDKDPMVAEEDAKLEAILSMHKVICVQQERIEELKSRERTHKLKIQNLAKSLTDQQYLTSSENDTTIRHRVVFFGPNVERSDDLMGLADMEDTSHLKEISQAVANIQEMATRVEAAIALNELDSIKSENIRLEKLLFEKKSEIQELNESLTQSKQRISYLELEKELALAEASVYKENLDLAPCQNKENSPMERIEIYHNRPRASPRSIFSPFTPGSNRRIKNQNVRVSPRKLSFW
jgi:hypothetical protein